MVAGADVGKTTHRGAPPLRGRQDVIDAPADVALAHVAPRRPPREQADRRDRPCARRRRDLAAEERFEQLALLGRCPIISALRSLGCTSISARAMLMSPHSTSSRPSSCSASPWPQAPSRTDLRRIVLASVRHVDRTRSRGCRPAAARSASPCRTRVAEPGASRTPRGGCAARRPNSPRGRASGMIVPATSTCSGT